MATPGGWWARGPWGAPPQSPGQAKVSPQGPTLWCLAQGQVGGGGCRGKGVSIPIQQAPGACWAGKGQAEGGGAFVSGWTFGIYFPQGSNW